MRWHCSGLVALALRARFRRRHRSSRPIPLNRTNRGIEVLNSLDRNADQHRSETASPELMFRPGSGLTAVELRRSPIGPWQGSTDAERNRGNPDLAAQAMHMMSFMVQQSRYFRSPSHFSFAWPLRRCTQRCLSHPGLRPISKRSLRRSPSRRASGIVCATQERRLTQSVRKFACRSVMEGTSP